MGCHKWTTLERHFLHIFFAVYRDAAGAGNSLEDLQRLFDHVHGKKFEDTPLSAQRLRDEYNSRNNNGRGKMWSNSIDKPMGKYTHEEQVERVQAHGEMRTAAADLGINLTPVYAELLPPDTAPNTSTLPMPLPLLPTATAKDRKKKAAANTTATDNITETLDPPLPNPSAKGREKKTPANTTAGNNSTETLRPFMPASPNTTTSRKRKAFTAMPTEPRETPKRRAALSNGPGMRPIPAPEPLRALPQDLFPQPAPYDLFANEPPANQTRTNMLAQETLTRLQTDHSALQARYNDLQQQNIFLQNRINYDNQQRMQIQGYVREQGLIYRLHDTVRALRNQVVVRDEQLLWARVEVDRLKKVVEDMKKQG